MFARSAMLKRLLSKLVHHLMIVFARQACMAGSTKASSRAVIAHPALSKPTLATIIVRDAQGTNTLQVIAQESASNALKPVQAAPGPIPLQIAHVRLAFGRGIFPRSNIQA
jgi:hypothetical protein